jgi:hypothetical protein
MKNNEMQWDAEKWDQDPLTSKKCFYVEDICHYSRSKWSVLENSSSQSGWFYYNGSDSKEVNRRQPDLVFRAFDNPADGIKNKDYRVERWSENFTVSLNCQMSPIENHVSTCFFFNVRSFAAPS